MTDATGPTTHDAIELACHRYELRSAAPLGALSRGVVRHGALLRVRFREGEVGYADLHPWTELGDLALAPQLGLLARGETTELTRASLAFAALDAVARAAGRSLWEGLRVPASHFLLPGIGGRDQAALEAALAEGFTRFKVKLGKDLDAEKGQLRDVCSFLQGVTLADGGPPRLRLDYNETLTPARLSDYWAELTDLAPFVDFIEDPFPFDAGGWPKASSATRMTFALDRAASEETAPDFGGVVVHKSARSGPVLPPGLSACLPERRLVVTSYLDHPVGQLGAAWVAAQTVAAAPDERHGLVSHRAYAPTRFSEHLGWHGPQLRLPEGHGFGFDEELAQTSWEMLT